jgi:hypothetical protein
MEECPICMENLKFNNRKIHITACKHSFHAMCLNKVKGGTCPCCRAVLDENKKKIAKIKDEIKLINEYFIRDKKRGKELISEKKKQTILLKKKQKEQEKDLKDGVLINNEVWIIARKEEIVKTKDEMIKAFASIIIIESRYPIMMAHYEDLLREKKNTLSALLKGDCTWIGSL